MNAALETMLAFRQIPDHDFAALKNAGLGHREVRKATGTFGNRLLSGYIELRDEAATEIRDLEVGQPRECSQPDVLAEVRPKRFIEGSRITFVQGHDLCGMWYRLLRWMCLRKRESRARERFIAAVVEAKGEISGRDVARELGAIRDRFSEKPAKQVETRPTNLPVQRTGFVAGERSGCR